jgi:hypothetical protein
MTRIPKAIQIGTHRVKVRVVPLQRFLGVCDIKDQEILLAKDKKDIANTFLHEIMEYIALKLGASRGDGKRVVIQFGHNPSSLDGDEWSIYVEMLLDTLRRNNLYWLFYREGK